MPTSSSTSPVPSHYETRYSIDTTAHSPGSPRETSPAVAIKQEPEFTLPNTHPLTPPADQLDVKTTAAEELDQAQHSAAMLSDLQCRPSPSPSPSLSPTAWWANLILYTLMAHFQTCYKSMLMAIWTISPSRMERLITLSTSRLASRSRTSSSTLQLWRSMALAQHNAATGLATLTERGASLALQQRLPTMGPLSHEEQQQQQQRRMSTESSADDHGVIDVVTGSNCDSTALGRTKTGGGTGHRADDDGVGR